MVGAGIDIFPAEWLSLELVAKFRYLTHLLTNFREGRDIVGSGAGQLDLPKSITEVYAGLTFYLGGKRECPPLTCEASGDPMSGAPSLTVRFNGSASGGCPPYTYSWDFGDGGSSSEQSPSHTYEKAGNYTAKLTVTDSKGNSCQKNVSYETAAEFIPTPEKPLVLHGVKFEFDKSRLTIKADSLLDLVATSLKRRPDVKVSVVGHCDWVGSEAYNQKLS